MPIVDNTNPLGPCLVSASAIPDPQKVPLVCRLNGQVMQNGSTAYVCFYLTLYLLSYNNLNSDQIFKVRRTIAHLSQGTTLEPGSIILTGTPKGVGFVRKPAVYLKHGDRVETWVGGGVGTLFNDVKEEKGISAKL